MASYTSLKQATDVFHKLDNALVESRLMSRIIRPTRTIGTHPIFGFVLLLKHATDSLSQTWQCFGGMVRNVKDSMTITHESHSVYGFILLFEACNWHSNTSAMKMLWNHDWVSKTMTSTHESHSLFALMLPWSQAADISSQVEQTIVFHKLNEAFVEW